MHGDCLNHNMRVVFKVAGGTPRKDQAWNTVGRNGLSRNGKPHLRSTHHDFAPTVPTTLQIFTSQQDR